MRRVLWTVLLALLAPCWVIGAGLELLQRFNNLALNFLRWPFWHACRWSGMSWARSINPEKGEWQDMKEYRAKKLLARGKRPHDRFTHHGRLGR